MIRKNVGIVLIAIALVMTSAPAVFADSANLEVIQTPQGISWEKLVDPEALAGKEAAEKHEMTVNALAVNPLNPQHIAISLETPFLAVFSTEPAYKVVGLYQSFDNGKTWQHAPIAGRGFKEGMPRLSDLWFEAGELYGYFLPHGVYKYDGEWHHIMGSLDFFGTTRSMSKPGWFKFKSFRDPAYPHIYYEPRYSSKELDPPVETPLAPYNHPEETKSSPPPEAGLYLRWEKGTDKGAVKLALPPEIKTSAYVPIVEVVRAEKATQLYVQIITTGGEIQFAVGDVWRVTIPDSVLQDPSILISTTLTLQIGSKEMVVEKTGEKQTIILDAAPEIPTGTERTFLPIRPVVEALGGKILWFGDEQRVEIQQGDRKVVLWINRATALVDGIEVPIDAANPAVRPYIAPPGRTMLPLRFIVEALGAKVEWIGETRTIIITYPKPAEPWPR